MKKAQIPVHWIFVIIAGSIILLFFVGFGIKYIDLQKSKLNAEIARGIDSTVSGLKLGGNFKTVKLNDDTNIEFNCDGFTINDEFNHKWSENVIFSPDNIESDELFVLTRKFAYPFSIENVIFIGYDDYKIFIIDDEFSKNIRSIIPEDFSNVEFVKVNDLNSIDFNEFKHAKIVSFSRNDIIERYNDEAEIVIVDPAEIGSLSYDSERYQFIGYTMILGAIFSSPKMYECQSKRLFSKVSVISDIYVNKARYLQDCCSNFRCSYLDISTTLNNFKEEFSTSSPNLNNINTLKDNIVDKNQNIFRKDCREVF